MLGALVAGVGARTLYDASSMPETVVTDEKRVN